MKQSLVEKENVLLDLKIQYHQKMFALLELVEKWVEFSLERDKKAEERATVFGLATFPPMEESTNGKP